MIVQNISAAATSLTDISFTLPRTDGQTAMQTLAVPAGRGRLRLAALRRPDRQGVADRRRHALAPGRHREVLHRLAAAGVNIEMISTSEIRISVVVNEADVDAAVAATHSAFELDADEVEAVVYGGTGR
jgi:aspartate kinase